MHRDNEQHFSMPTAKEPPTEPATPPDVERQRRSEAIEKRYQDAVAMEHRATALSIASSSIAAAGDIADMFALADVFALADTFVRYIETGAHGG